MSRSHHLIERRDKAGKTVDRIPQQQPRLKTGKRWTNFTDKQLKSTSKHFNKYLITTEIRRDKKLIKVETEWEALLCSV